MRGFPPTDAEAAAEVGYEGSDERIDYEVRGNTHVSRVVSREHDLLLLRKLV